METADLKGLEDRIYQQYNRDGALETLLGVGLLYSAMMFVPPGPTTLIGIYPIILIAVGRAWKRKITYPRLGYAEVLEIRNRGKRKAILLIVLTVLALLGLTVLGFWAGRAGFATQHEAELPFPRAAFGAFIAAIIAGAGVIHRAKHVIYLAALLFALFVATDYLHLAVAWAFGIPAVIFLGIGLMRLRRFLKENPKLEAPEAL